MIYVFQYRNRNIFCFVGIDLVFYKKSCSDGYNNQSEVFNIIYQALNSRATTGVANIIEQDHNTVVNDWFQVNHINTIL